MRITSLLLLLGAGTSLRAQTPAPPPPGATLSGIVRDLAGNPLPDVDISLMGEAARARSDSAGRFALRSIAPGGHTALFRHIGFRSVEYRWTARPGAELQIAVAMTPAPKELERVVVEAPGASRKRGTSSIEGTVTDSTGAPVNGADVRLLGSGLSTVTDSSGKFLFQLLAAAPYIVRARSMGRAPALVFMQIADDDHRGITMKMFGLPRNARDTASASGFGVVDAGFDAFDHRQRAAPGNPVLGPADLFRADRASLAFLLQQYRDNASMRPRRSSIVAEGVGSTSAGDCILLDGRRAIYQPLDTFNSLTAQLVEVFRANASIDPFMVTTMDALHECQGSMDHHPAYFVVWTRSLR